MNLSQNGDIVPSSQNVDTIQPINRDTVHRICSGQVVLSLAIAVKELVENSLDAGATCIDVQLKEYGSEIIEVFDNGSGVKPENFQALTLKHYTSKIKQFDDLSTLTTLGFRGEALSSLCALGDMTVLTKHASAKYAAKITYDRSGKIVTESVAARDVGTTITLNNLFSTLPVRRKEFLKNLKREFNKMCQLLNAYCLVSKGVKFSCSNRTKGTRNLVVNTNGFGNVRDNIVNIFSSQQISTLIDVELTQPDEASLKEYNLKFEDDSLPFTFDFIISSVVHGSGRSTTDRQFLYINSRPCEHSKLLKLINGVYKQYNASQYPFVFLNVLTHSCLVDINVTPDKRQVFLEKEKLLFATVKTSLVEALKMFPSSYKIENVDLTQNSTITNYFGSGQSEEGRKGVKRSHTHEEFKRGSLMERFKKRSKTENDKCASKKSTRQDLLLNTFIEIATKMDKEVVKKEEVTVVCPRERRDSIATLNQAITVENVDSKISKSAEVTQTVLEKNEDAKTSVKKEQRTNRTHIEEYTHKDETAKVREEKEDKAKEQKIAQTMPDEDLEISLDTTSRDHSSRKTVTLNFSLKDIQEAIERKNDTKENKNIRVRFRSKINPDSNKTAEAELRRQISKQDFAKMSIIGQFNKGFIVTQLDNDLFIIDQHASDEKFNFEDLQANTVMENQLLVNAKPLQLTAGNESLLIENEEIFNKSGFKFKIDHAAPCTKKVSLTSVPLSKSTIFGKDDIDEMLFMLQDSNHTMCRPSRIRAMFASRACRKSIMVGDSLSQSDMRRLVDHMGEIEQPWNCPHGRPTMRHLINLDLIHRENE